MPKPPKVWDGKQVHIIEMPTKHDTRTFEMGLTKGAAQHLFEALQRFEETYFSTGEEITEIKHALAYVLWDVPASSPTAQAHRRMEASKGMTPDGGFKYPNPPRDGRGFIHPGDINHG